MVVVTTAPYL